jgi:hypothetical protein
VSVGHLGRVFEEAGIATVIVAVRAFQPRLQAMAAPRLVTTPYLMGRPLGLPGDRQGQRRVIEAALQLVETAQHNGSIVEL